MIIGMELVNANQVSVEWNRVSVAFEAEDVSHPTAEAAVRDKIESSLDRRKHFSKRRPKEQVLRCDFAAHLQNVH